MPTIPPDRSRLSEPEPHQHRQIAESFGSDAERYDRARPGYPQVMVGRIIAASPGPEVLDVGTGTGIAARQFQAAGCRVLGVEVDARMAEVARRGGLEVEVAAFEAWDPAGREFDAVVAGQTWHWVDPVAGAAKAAEALRPGGRLAVFWNVFQPSPDVREAFSAVYRRVMPDLPFNPWAMPASDGYSVLCTKAAAGIREVGTFGDPEQWRFDWERSYTRDEWLDQLPTHGGHTQLRPAQLEELMAGVGAATDATGGSFTMGYAVMVVTAARTGAGDIDTGHRHQRRGTEVVDMKLEVVLVPVADVDRAKDFYKALGWREDADFAARADFRVVQLTPPGSACSIIFGTGVTSAAPGSAQGLQLTVADIGAARAELAARGAEMSEVFHDAGGVFHHAGTAGRVAGPAPDHKSYGSFASFSDPDGNGWLLQEITTRLPGR